MPLESPLTKRIKRHVVGRVRTYFAATAPGFENICLGELHDLPLSKKTASVVSGGVEFQGQLMDCYLANLYLRTASRILMRIETVYATHFSRLQKKLSDIPWELFLRANPVPQIHVTTRHCRLHHTGAISERLLKTIADRKKNIEYMPPVEKPSVPVQNIYVRGVDDRFTVSIDSSGDNLYKRGIKRHAGTAPLRETAAAAALMLAGYTGSEPLVDPMCGSGTFALEAALMAKNIPPGCFRDFAFMEWPSYQHKRWEYLKHESEKRIIAPKTTLILASDKDSVACRRLNQCLQQFSLDDTVTVLNTDFFELDEQQVPSKPGFIAINPPYGRRIGSKRESEQLFITICRRLNQHYKGWQLVLIVPHKKWAKHISFKSREYPLSHGGLKLRFRVGTIA